MLVAGVVLASPTLRKRMLPAMSKARPSYQISPPTPRSGLCASTHSPEEGMPGLFLARV
jgi:hypothetical protein